MKSLVILAGLVALSLASVVPPPVEEIRTKTVDADFVTRQKKVLSLLKNIGQLDHDAEYYKVGKEYNIEAHADSYTNKMAYKQFIELYKSGFLPKHSMFSIFYKRMREEAMAIFHLFFYAKDFETFYKTAAFAKVHLNEGQFIYAFYVAVIHRSDTTGIVLPAPYELFPELFANTEVFSKINRIKEKESSSPMDVKYGIVKEDEHFVFYANYSDSYLWNNEEYKLSYFTEDIGLNSYYYYFHSTLPFWMDGKELGIFKERRGEIYFFFYQQLLTRYYLERLSNGLGPIPTFSWYFPIKSGYTPLLTANHPFVQRNNYYSIPIAEHIDEIQFVDTYEKTFLQFLEQGHFKAYNQEIDFSNSKAINFVGNYWQSNDDLYEKSGPRNYHRSYEATARFLLSAAPKPLDKYSVMPSALSFYQTSLRDPMFYQLYSRIMKYVQLYKQYLEPYNQDNLHYVGVKINDVKVDKLITYFDMYDYDINNGIYMTADELKSNAPLYKIRQPRLDHKPFEVTIDIKSESACEAAVKFFLGPKYDEDGNPMKLEDNWMNFFELEWFVAKLQPGQNKIVRKSSEFTYFKSDSLPLREVSKLLESGKVPADMSEEYWLFPKRLMLPKGTESGFPMQLFVLVYPYQPMEKHSLAFTNIQLEKKPLGYPFDRPVNQLHFKQPNMFFRDVEIYHEGWEWPYKYNVPEYFTHHNEVPKN